MATIYQRTEGGPWWGRFALDGKPVRFSTGTRNRRLAQKEADRREEEARDRAKLDESVTLLTACAMFFVQKSDLKPTTLKNYRISALRLVEFFDDCSMNLISHEDLQKFWLHRVESGGKIAGKRDLSFLSSLYTTAKLWPNGPTVNPFDKFRLRDIPDANKRHIWLTEKEIQTLLSVCRTDQQRLFVLMATSTGMRSNEMFKLRWSEVDLDENLITLGNRDRLRTKGGVGRSIPLTQALADTLRSTPRVSAWVFPGTNPAKPVTSMKTFWNRAVKEAGLEGVRIHDLRHTFGTRAQQKGVDVYSIMDLMGHKNITSSQRYVHPSLETKREAIRKIQHNPGTPTN